MKNLPSVLPQVIYHLETFDITTFCKPGGKEDLSVKNVQRTVLMMGRIQEQIADTPRGNTLGPVRIDQYLLNSGTITTIEGAHNIADMKYSVSPVVNVAVQCKDCKDVPKLVDGLKKLPKSDPIVVCTTEKSGGRVTAGCADMHVKSCLKDLRDEYAQVDIMVEDPIVSHRGTALETSKVTHLLSSIPNAAITVAASFGNDRIVYAPGHVDLKPAILHNTQAYVKEKLGSDNVKPRFYVFHGGSDSSKKTSNI